MADGIVQVFPDSTGKKLDTTELTRIDTTVVERERLNVADACDTTTQALAGVENKRLQVQAKSEIELLEQILEKLSEIHEMLADRE